MNEILLRFLLEQQERLREMRKAEEHSSGDSEVSSEDSDSDEDMGLEELETEDEED